MDAVKATAETIVAEIAAVTADADASDVVVDAVAAVAPVQVDRGGAPGGRNLPPSKYASPQGDQRGNDSRDSRATAIAIIAVARQIAVSTIAAASHGSKIAGQRASSVLPLHQMRGKEDEFVLPGESLAKYRNRPAAAVPSAPIVEPELHDEPQPIIDEPVAAWLCAAGSQRAAPFFRTAKLASRRLRYRRRSGNRIRRVVKLSRKSGRVLRGSRVGSRTRS